MSTHLPRLGSLLALLVLLAFSPQSASAQCDPQWIPGDGLPGLTGGNSVTDIALLPDGDIVYCGNFLFAGGLPANRIARYHRPTRTWSSLSSGLDGNANRMAILSSGDIVVTGAFTSAGGVPANHIARWDGSAWHPLGGGVDVVTGILAPLPNGDLVCAGNFTSVSGVAANNIARWDGTQWSSLGAGLNLYPWAITVMPGGDLIAGGNFSASGDTPLNCIARWNGANWSTIGGGTDNTVLALNALPSGDLVAGGFFLNAGGAPASHVAIWNGTQWSQVGGGLPSFVRSLSNLSTGEIIADASGLMKFNGSTWSTAVPADGVALPLVTAADGRRFSSRGEWSGTQWQLLGDGINEKTRVLSVLPSGEVIAGGDFSHIGSLTTRSIARWNGSSWSPLSTGMLGGSYPTPYVSSILNLPNGDFLAGGVFTSAGGVPARFIARWDGSAWHDMNTANFDGMAVTALAQLHNGNIVAAGEFRHIGTAFIPGIAQWDGSSWLPLGGGIPGADAGRTALCLTVMPNGDLISAGMVSGVPGSYISKWDGSTWSALGAGVAGYVYAMAILPSGDLAVGGHFERAGTTPLSGLARWDGTTWSSFGLNSTSYINGLGVLPDGDLIVSGHFFLPGQTTAVDLARWNGASWTVLVTDFVSGTPGAVAIHSSGELLVAGGFIAADSVSSANFARFTETNIPWVSLNPHSVRTFSGSTISFSATPAAGYSDVSFHWKHNGIIITDGPGGASPGGGTVSNSSGPLPSPTHAQPAILSITGFQPSDTGDYTCTFFNSCGESVTQIATLSVRCLGDFNQDDTTDFFDYLDFLQAFAANDPAADVNHDAVINLFDYLDFVQAFTSGC